MGRNIPWNVDPGTSAQAGLGPGSGGFSVLPVSGVFTAPRTGEFGFCEAGARFAFDFTLDAALGCPVTTGAATAGAAAAGAATGAGAGSTGFRSWLLANGSADLTAMTGVGSGGAAGVAGALDVASGIGASLTGATGATAAGIRCDEDGLPPARGSAR